MASEDRLRELEEKYEDYKVYDNQGEKIGKVDDLFVDETDREEYIGVKMGFLGRKSTLIPMDIVRVNEGDRSIQVSETKDHVKSAPSFDDDEDITPDYEDRIRSYFGLESLGTSSAGYGEHSGTAEEPTDRGSRDHETEHETDDDTREYEDTGQHERSTPDDSRETPEYRDDDERSTGRDERGEPEGTSEGLFSVDDTGSSATEETGESPTTRETEETETIKEGGKTKIRRRVIREEIIEEDDQDPRSL